MKAFIYRKYGSPENLELTEVEVPIPKADEVLVRNKALSLNPAEWHFLRGMFVIKLQNGFSSPKNLILRSDLSGVVEAVGSKVTQFKPGDAVYGRSDKGGFAELTVLPQERLALKPASISFEEAAAIPLAFITALQGLRHPGAVKPGEKVLINGASGGIGTFAVQLCKMWGAEVTGVCSGKNVELVKSLGADTVIDYQKEDFTHRSKTYDFIFDCIGNRKVKDQQKALKPNGRIVVIGFSGWGNMLHALWKSIVNKGKVFTLDASVSNKDLVEFYDQFEQKSLKPVIDTVYDFEDLPKAMQVIADRRARGKLVVKLS